MDGDATSRSRSDSDRGSPLQWTEAKTRWGLLHLAQKNSHLRPCGRRWFVEQRDSSVGFVLLVGLLLLLFFGGGLFLFGPRLVLVGFFGGLFTGLHLAVVVGAVFLEFLLALRLSRRGRGLFHFVVGRASHWYKNDRGSPEGEQRRAEGNETIVLHDTPRNAREQPGLSKKNQDIDNFCSRGRRTAA